MPGNQTRRNKNKNKDKMDGGDRNKNKNKDKMDGGDRNKNKNKSVGGRKTHKAPSDWNKKVMKIYHDMKKKNPATKLGDAMKHASALKKKGQL